MHVLGLNSERGQMGKWKVGFIVDQTKWARSKVFKESRFKSPFTGHRYRQEQDKKTDLCVLYANGSIRYEIHHQTLVGFVLVVVEGLYQEPCHLKHYKTIRGGGVGKKDEWIKDPIFIRFKGLIWRRKVLICETGITYSQILWFELGAKGSLTCARHLQDLCWSWK